MKKWGFFCFLVGYALIGRTQDFKPGFNFLETGQFSKAKSFFEDALKEYPENLTAKICFARALGLSDAPAEANNFLAQLAQENPDNLEVRLNYAESFLWAGNFEDGLEYYLTLYKDHSENFLVNLGLANTYSNLKEYKAANTFILDALDIDPENASALNSLKYIRLGWAYQNQLNGDFATAESLLLANSNRFPDDPEVLESLANLRIQQKQPLKAKKVLEQLIALDSNRCTAWLTYSVALNELNRPKRARDILKKVKKQGICKQDSARFAARWIQSLLWTQKFKEAEAAIGAYSTTFTKQQANQLRGALAMYRADLNTAEKVYTDNGQDSVLYLKMGLANVYYAQKQYGKSVELIADIDSANQQVLSQSPLPQRIKNDLYPTLKTAYAFAYDNGENFSNTVTNDIAVPLSYRTTITAGYSYRHVNSKNINVRGNLNAARLQLHYRFFKQNSASLGLSQAATQDINPANFKATLWDFRLKLRPFRKNQTEVGVFREIQDYNYSLVAAQIINVQYFVNHNISTDFGLGWYNQYFFTSQSDNNERNLWFSSLYYLFRENPTVKAGINYQTMRYNEQRPELYFSPSRYFTYEGFAEVLKEQKPLESGFEYQLNVAVGQQRINNSELQATYRVQARVGYSFRGVFQCSLNGLKSNIAATTIAGFTFTQVGLSLLWKPLKKYAFRNAELEQI